MTTTTSINDKQTTTGDRDSMCDKAYVYVGTHTHIHMTKSFSQFLHGCMYCMIPPLLPLSFTVPVAVVVLDVCFLTDDTCPGW